MAFQEFDGKLDGEPAGFEAFDGELDKPAKPAEGPSLFERAKSFFTSNDPAPNIDALTEMPAEQAAPLITKDPLSKPYTGERTPLSKAEMVAMSRAPTPEPAKRVGEMRAMPTESVTAQALRAFDRKPLDNSLIGAVGETAGDAARGLSKVVPSIAKSAYSVIEAGSDIVGADRLGGFARSSQQAGADWLGQFDNPNGDRMVTNAFQSLGTAIAGGAAGGPNLAVGLMVGQSAADHYSELRAGKLDVADSLEGAAVYGVAEFVGERIGMRSLGRMVSGIASKAGIPPMAALKEALKQQGEEQVTLAIQAAYDKVGSGSLRSGLTWDQYLSDAVETAKTTAIMTAAAAGGGRIARGAQGLAQSQFGAPKLADYQAATQNVFGRTSPPGPVPITQPVAPPAPAPVAPVRVEDQPTQVMTPEEILSQPLPRLAGVATPATTPANPGIKNEQRIDANDSAAVLSRLGMGGSPDAGGLVADTERRGDQLGGGDGDPALDVGRVLAEPAKGPVSSADGGRADRIVDSGRATSDELGSRNAEQATAGLPDLAARSIASTPERVAQINSDFASAAQAYPRQLGKLPRDLTPVKDQKTVAAFDALAESLAAVTGAPRVVLVESSASFDGVNHGGQLVVNLRGLQKPAVFVAGHESSHSWQDEAEDAERLGDKASDKQKAALQYIRPMENAIWEMIPEASRATYARDVMSMEQPLADIMANPAKARTLKREMLADFHGKRLSDADTVSELAKRAPAHFKQYAQRVISMLNSAIGKLRGKRDGLGGNDIDPMIKDLTKAKMIWVNAVIAHRRGGAESAQPLAASQRSSMSERQAGENDKQFAKRVVDKRDAPATLPENHADYFTMDGAKVVPVSDLVSTKSAEQNQQGGDNGAKRMAAAAGGELSKRGPITVMPGETAGKYEVVDGNGTLTSVAKYGWKSMPVKVVSREAGQAMIAEDKAKDAARDAAKTPVAAMLNGRPYAPKQDNFKAPLVADILPAETVTLADELVAKFYVDRPPVSISAADRAKADDVLRPMLEAAESQKVAFDQKILDIVSRTGSIGQMLAPVKGIKRAAEKLVEEEFRDYDMKDLLRSTIVVNQYQDAVQILAEIRKEFNVLRVKDRSDQNLLTGADVKVEPRKKFGGYADVMVNVTMPNGTIAEIQINVPAMLSAKGEQGHKLYEAAREQPDGSKMRQRINMAMEGFYDAAFNLANATQPAAQDRNADSDIGAAPELGRLRIGSSSSPESASLNTRPSGNSTNSSPENEAKNSQPGGNLSGNFIGSPVPPIVNQSSPKRSTEPAPLYLSRAVKNAQKLHDWAVSAGIQNVVPAAKMHVTLAYSKTPVDSRQVGAAPPGATAIPGRLARMGDQKDIVLMLYAPGLESRHRALLDKGATWDHDRNYAPHVTLSYTPQKTDLSKVKVPVMKLELGPEVAADLKKGWSEDIRGEPKDDPSLSGRFKELKARAVRKAAGRKMADAVTAKLKLSRAERDSTALDLMTGEAKQKAFMAPVVGELPAVVQFLEDRRIASGLPVLDIATEAGRDGLSDLMAAEAMAAISNAGNALEWYDATIQTMLDRMAIKFPELKSDEGARTAMLLCIAVTSQGQNVETNLSTAIRLYPTYRDTGRFLVDGSGESKTQMELNFAFLNDLLKEMGPDMLARFLKTPFAVGELKRMGYKIGGELMDEQVLGSSVLGPKIGFGFFSNLMGNFEPITMDMWFMRLVGRLTGKLRSFDSKKFAKQTNSLAESLRLDGQDGIYAADLPPEMVEAAKSKIEDEDGNMVPNEDAIVALSREVDRRHQREFIKRRAEFDAGTRKKTQLVFAAGNIVKSMDKPRDSPASGGERRLLRDVVTKMVDKVAKAHGTRVPPASLQALVWYPEQELYKALGVKLSVTSQDYAGAALKTLIAEGIDEQQILDAGRSGAARQDDGGAVAAGPGGAGRQARRTDAIQGGEREAFIAERVEREDLRKDRKDPKRSKLIFEVAPDPNDLELSTRWRALSNERRTAISRKVARSIAPKVLSLYDNGGIFLEQTGSYEEDTNPSFALMLTRPGDAVEAAKALGFVLSQDSMVVLSPKPVKGAEQTGAVVIQVGEKSPDEIDVIYKKLRAIEVDGNRPVGGQSTANGQMTILNFSDLSTSELSRIVDETLGNEYDIGSAEVYAAFPGKKDYDYASASNDPRGNRGLVRQRARDLRAEAQAELQRAIADPSYSGRAAGRKDEAVADALGKPADTSTPEFKRWWGDSSLVDAAGNPMVLYHGTGAKFTTFKRSEYGAMGPAVYLGDDREVAETYKPSGRTGRIMEVYARGKYLDNRQWSDFIIKHGWAGAEAAAKADGWSGVHDTMFENAVAVWSPADIKAVDNRGTFDESDNISRSSRAPDTAEFKRWFGDSKVVDRAGKPLVVYHATSADFSAFRITGEGAHFGTLEQAEARYGLGSVMPVYLAIKSPVRISDINSFGPSALAAELVRRGVISRKEASLALEAGGRSKTWPKLRDLLASKGYDGAVYANEQEGEGDSFMAFRPEQIKSAIGNNGTFDPANPDISMSRRLLADDADKQVAFLEARAKAAGYKNVDQFFEKDPESFNSAAQEYREENEAEALYSRRAPTAWRDAQGRFQLKPTAWVHSKAAPVINAVLAKVGLNAIDPALKRQIRRMQQDIEKSKVVAVQVASETFKMSELDRQMVSDIVEQELATGVVPPAHAARMAAGIQFIMDQQTNDLIAVDMLSKDTADRWRGAYLPRFYTSKLLQAAKEPWAWLVKQTSARASVMKGISGKHLKGRGLWETVPHDGVQDYLDVGWQVRDPSYEAAVQKPDFDLADFPTVQVWRDFTRTERDSMGEIRDAGFRFTMGYLRTQKDIALGRMFMAIAADNELASKNEKTGWVQVPDGSIEGTGGVRRYGKLSGMWVEESTMNHLANHDQGTSEAMRLYRKAMSMWKEGKTVLNPVSHFNNVVGNLSMAHFAGVSYWEGHKYAGTILDLVKKVPMVKEAEDAGLFLGTMTQEELLATMPKELQAMAAIQASQTERAADFAWNVLSMWLRRPAGVAYEAEDTFFRYMIYRDARKNGLDPQSAVEYSQRYIFTYDDLPQTARKIRDFGIPFFAYTYKVVPAMIHTAAHYPHRLLAPAALMWSLNAAMYGLAAGEDDEDWRARLERWMKDPERQAKANAMEKEERHNLPPWMKGNSALMTPKAVRLGIDEVTGAPMFWDIAQIMPGGNMFDIQNNAGGVPWAQSMMPSHPLFTMMAAMFLNKDTFTGKEVVDSNDTSAEAAEKRTAWLWKQITPAIAIGNYHSERLANVVAQLTGEPVTWLPRDATGVGKDGLPVRPGLAAMQTVGIKIRPLDLEMAGQIEQGQRKTMIREIDAEIKRLRRLNNKGALSDRNMEAELERAQVKKDRLRDGLTVDGDEKP